MQGPDRRVAAFASCDMGEYGESGGRLKWYDVTYGYWPQFTYQDCMVSESFGYKGGSTYADGHVEQAYEFDTENRIVKISSMDESDIVFGEPKIGNHSVLSQCILVDHSAARCVCFGSNTNPFLNCGYYVSSKRDWYHNSLYH